MSVPLLTFVVMNEPEVPNPGHYPTHEPTPFAAQIYRDAGVEPPWLRVWDNGKDVTDHISLWPTYYLNLARAGVKPWLSHFKRASISRQD
jgi:hypothetical protein